MLFVTLCKDRAGTSKERTARRLGWSHPAGYKLVAEYWLQTPDPRVIIVAEAGEIAPIMAAVADWDDVFEMTVVPALSAEDGMRLAKQSMLVTPTH